MATYEFETIIRYSEIDSLGYLTPSALIDLFQTTSTYQSEELGYGVEYLKENHRAWVLSYWQICIDKLPRFKDKVYVQTWSSGIRSALGNRNFVILDADRNILSYANSLWVYIDTENAHPMKPPAEMVEAYGCEPPLEMEVLSRKITLPCDMQTKDDFIVKHYFIDTNNHMNNAKYILTAMEYIPNGLQIKGIRAEYKKQALLGEILTPHVKIDGNTITVVTYDSNGNHNATIQFTCE